MQINIVCGFILKLYRKILQIKNNYYNSSVLNLFNYIPCGLVLTESLWLMI